MNPYQPTICTPYAVSIRIQYAVWDQSGDYLQNARATQDFTLMLRIQNFNDNTEIVQPFNVKSGEQEKKFIIYDLYKPLELNDLGIVITDLDNKNWYSTDSINVQALNEYNYQIYLAVEIGSYEQGVYDENGDGLGDNGNYLTIEQLGTYVEVPYNTVCNTLDTNNFYIYTPKGWKQLGSSGSRDSMSLDDVTNFCKVYSPDFEISDSLKNKTVTSDALWSILQQIIPFSNPHFENSLSIGNSTITESQLATVVEVLTSIAPAAGVSF